MSSPILDLSNTNNWRSVWFGSFVAAQAPDRPNGYTIPIPPVTVPILLDKRIIALTVSSSDNTRRRRAGWVNRKIQTGILSGGIPDVTDVDGKSLFLNKINIVFFKQLAPNYALEIVPGWWLDQVSFGVWEYIGVDSDTTTEQLNRIEQSVDRIAQ